MGPLAGYKIIEIKGLGPGPYAGMLLADLGAELIVVERASGAAGISLPSEADLFSRGKKSIALDLKNPSGLAALLTLIEQADAVFEGFRPGVAERLGFGPDVCMELNPRLVYGRMTGWGQSGPLAHTAGHDINYISLTGALNAIGNNDEPVLPLNLVGDFAGGSLFLVTGMLAALLEAQKSGHGQIVDAAITDGSAHMMTLFYTMSRLGVWSTQREGNLLDGGAPFYRVYSTQDGRHVSVGALEPQFFEVLIEKTGLPERFIKEQNNREVWPELKGSLASAFASKTRDQWAEVFSGSDACVMPVLDYEEALGHPHNQARKTYVSIDGIQQPAPAPRFSRSECDTPQSPRAVGANSVEVLSRWGFSDDDIDKLKQSGALD